MSGKWLCSQIIVASKESNFNDVDMLLGVIIRNVIANNKAEAIGKFVLNAADIKAHKKLNVDCIHLNTLTEVE